ncbi:MAG: hypothetical protein ACRDL2_03465 [Gaiellaceae bacterium]
MARKPKTKPKLDRAQEKARKQKRLAAILGGFLVLVLVYEVPHTMKLMHKSAKAPVVETSSSTPPAATPTSPAPAATPSNASAPPVAAPAYSSLGSGLVSAVQVTADPGQLTQFERFASKDPFLQSVQKASGTASPAAGGTGATPTGTKTSTSAKPKTPPAPPPTSAVISLNGELMSVAVGAAFPASGGIFQLDSLTQKSAKVTIVGGSYADGAPALTLAVGTPVTLQNTADGTRYTLILEPQGTQVPTSTTPTTTTPATTTTGSVVPAGPGG